MEGRAGAYGHAQPITLIQNELGAIGPFDFGGRGDVLRARRLCRGAHRGIAPQCAVETEEHQTALVVDDQRDVGRQTRRSLAIRGL